MFSAMEIKALTPAQIARFWSKVDRGGPNGCWLWRGWTNHSGHPRFDLGFEKVLATHVALTIFGKPRPASPNDLALHGDLCPANCCNPDHIRWGTGKQNADDRDRLGRRNPARGEAHGVAKLTDEKVRYIRSSPLNQYQLAAELGVSQVLVGRVRNGHIWTHVV